MLLSTIAGNKNEDNDGEGSIVDRSPTCCHLRRSYLSDDAQFTVESRKMCVAVRASARKAAPRQDDAGSAGDGWLPNKTIEWREVYRRCRPVRVASEGNFLAGVKISCASTGLIVNT
jgi:hypothetical protein